MKKEKLCFTGHDTFHCRAFWLKKGYDFLNNGGFFNDEAVIELGVGRNMVNAVRYWMRCFGMTDELDTLQPIAKIIFDDNEGLDPYCEDKATIWLLHYLLITTHKASIYPIAFNHFRKERIEFNKDQMLRFLKVYCSKQDYNVHDSSLDRDIDVFLHNYISTSRSKNIEESLSAILQELNIIEKTNKESYKIESSEQSDLPSLVVLFAIVRQMNGGMSISFQELLTGIDSVGSVFALNANGMMYKIESLLNQFPQELVFTDDGGIRLLQFKKQFFDLDILKQFYETQSVAFG
jgi:Protein of unknown function (DUF4007)